MSEVSVFSEHVCELGEGPSYDPATDTLFWFDIVHGHLLEQKLSGGAVKVNELGQMASATRAASCSPPRPACMSVTWPAES